MRLNIQKHEQASVCSGVCEWSCSDPEKEEKWLSAVMRSVAVWVTENGGLIGHIKVSMRISESKSFSITLNEAMVTPCKATVNIEIAAIVFGVTPEELEQEILRLFHGND